MKYCPRCDGTMVHAEGGWHCTECTWSLSSVPSHSQRRHDRRYKRVLRRLDKIGARLAGVK